MTTEINQACHRVYDGDYISPFVISNRTIYVNINNLRICGENGEESIRNLSEIIRKFLLQEYNVQFSNYNESYKIVLLLFLQNFKNIYTQPLIGDENMRVFIFLQHCNSLVHPCNDNQGDDGQQIKRARIEQ